MPEHTSKWVTLPFLLKRVSSHLDVLAAQVYGVEEAVSETIEQNPTTKSGTIKQLQSLDFLRQSLEDLALLTHLVQSDDELAELHVHGVDKIQQKLKLNVTQKLLDDRHSSKSDLKVGEVDLF